MSKDFEVSTEEVQFRVVQLPDYSDWRCQLFGMGEALVLRPEEGNVPNRFWRVMQYLFFGNKWTKENQ